MNGIEAERRQESEPNIFNGKGEGLQVSAKEWR